LTGSLKTSAKPIFAARRAKLIYAVDAILEE
jgi:hypothetical protein